MPRGEQLGLGAVVKRCHGGILRYQRLPTSALLCIGRIISAQAAVLPAQPTSESSCGFAVLLLGGRGIKSAQNQSRILGRRPTYSRRTPVASSNDRTKTIGVPESSSGVRMQMSRALHRPSSFQASAGSPSQTRLSSNDHHSNDEYYIIINGSKVRPGGTNMLRDRDYSTLLFREITSHKVL